MRLKYHFYPFVLALLSVCASASAQSLDDVLHAVQRNDATAISEYLDRGLDPDITDAEGNTILMLAARHGSEDLVKLLLSRKADPLKRNPYGDTALNEACLEGHLEVAKLLVSAGSPLNGPGWTPLHYAAFAGAADLVGYLLDRGANKDALAPNGYTALMLAVRNGQEAAVRALLYRDPDLEVQGPRGETALSIATEKGEKDLAALLRRAGAAR